MHESLVKYLSGLLDTDGCLSFSFSKRKESEDDYYMGLMLNLSSSSNIDQHGLIDSLPLLTGVGKVYQNDKKNMQIKTWTVCARSDLEKILPRVIKHMNIKAKHWQWLLETRRKHIGVRLSREQAKEFAQASKVSRAENVGPLKPKNHPTWAWLAGFLDGDGHFYIRCRAKDQCMVMYVGATVHEIDEPVLHWVQKAFGGKIYEHSKNARAKRWRRYLGLKHSSFALDFLPRLAKHSRLKRHKIDQMINIHSQRLSTRRAAA